MSWSGTKPSGASGGMRTRPSASARARCAGMCRAVSSAQIAPTGTDTHAAGQRVARGEELDRLARR